MTGRSETHDRPTPTPEPGEWIPEDSDFTSWRLVCRLCKAGTEAVEAPLDRERRREIALDFLKKHEKCLDQEVHEASSRP